MHGICRMTASIDEHDDRDADLSATLRCVDRAVTVPAIDPEREAALLATFDATHGSHKVRDTFGLPRRRAMHSRWLRVAAILILSAGVTAIWFRTPSVGPESAPAETDEEVGDFVAWPGAAALPPFESGHLVRMDLPASVLPSLGLFPPASDATMVRADVLIGQDGLARAVRLVPAVSAIQDEVSQ